MSKIICEICGTSYPDTEPRCPICGWTQDGIDLGDLGIDESDLDLTVEETPPVPRKTREIFDYDAVNSKEGRKSAAQPDEEEEPEEQRANPFLVVLLTILIVALLAATGFVLIKYFIPNMKADKTPETNAPVITESATETTELTIPCTGLSLVSGIAELNAEGQNWLLHVVVTPEDTTDVLTYQSMDESIAIVNDEGRVTAVSEGQTTVIITCGSERLECPVTVSYQEPTEATTEAATEAPTQAPAEGETTPAASTEANNSGTSAGVTLKLKKTDITFGVGGVYTTLELDCDLKPEDIEWSTRNSNVAIVKNGVVTAVGPGLTVITAKYGDQTAECIVRCNF